ncbi:hypothetical protein EUX98_g5407 [Antrodiella citrinella]|uniref:Uncharacterized protein n=1 Tax=Antrodiella citrinella TaxID=2447956 RepID=A0A4S4MRI9_9APHY|nr:hypothetical protein EUX98_g5407 [Antrodiella citrinella]
MMEPPPSSVPDVMAMDEPQQTTQNTQQATQPDSEEWTAEMDRHLWGFLFPCNPTTITRIDFARTKTEYRLGRDRTNDVVFSGKKVSNFHCEITFQNDETIKVQDKSSNGTYINGEKIGKGQYALLKDGNEIAFGTAQPQTGDQGREDYRFMFRSTATQQKDGLYTHYDLVKELGKGSFATVMLAVNKRTGIDYAVKIIHHSKLRAHSTPNPDALVSPTDSQKWAREISIMETLAHENICQLKEVFFGPSTINLVLEYVNGGDLLDHILKHGGISEDGSRDITYQLCGAMAYIHNKGITHRDLKPENVLITADIPPKVKVADFGLAKMVDSYTMLRTMCGTPSYLAPEVVLQVNQQGYQQVVDSWSVGVIVFSMLTNVAPFRTLTDVQEAGEPVNMRQQVIHRSVQWECLMDKRVSNECTDFIRRLLQNDPKKRLKMTVAHTHPWLHGHSHEEYALRFRAGPSNGNASGGDGGGNGAGGSGPSIDGDASMQSAVPDASMEDVSQPESMPGAFDSTRLHRRSNVLTYAQEEPDAAPAILAPSQEMMDSATAEEQRFYNANSRPKKRKEIPFDGSLTPIPDDREDDEERAAVNGIEDLSMAEIASNSARSPSPPLTRAKRARPATSSPPKSQKARGKKPQVDDENGSPAPSSSEGRPRRSTRLHNASPSPQKAPKARGKAARG